MMAHVGGVAEGTITCIKCFFEVTETVALSTLLCIPLTGFPIYFSTFLCANVVTCTSFILKKLDRAFRFFSSATGVEMGMRIKPFWNRASFV